MYQGKTELKTISEKIHNFPFQELINYLKHLPLAILANYFYGFPSKNLKVIGVTGTDGKTTTVSLIHHILVSAGFKASMVSTVSAKIGTQEIDTGFHVTAPDPWLLQKLLREMVKNETEYAVLETTSHGLDQFRLWGVSFEVGVLTNVTHEHLDYHKTFDNYRLAKLRLFQKSKTAILNVDNQSYNFFRNIIKSYGIKIVSYGVRNKADFTPKSFSFETNLEGEYNKLNILAAIAAVSQFNINSELIKGAVSNFLGVKGRLEEINEGQNFRAIVDFAHTPNALKQVLSLLHRQLKKDKKLIVVYGSAGLRDQAKRSMMGEISGHLAEISIITAEDPRTEDVNEICQQIAKGCESVKGNYQIIVDRQEAINFAIRKLAKKDDTVVVCGKGHEQSMCYGQTEYPWSDQAAVRKALREV